jgi:murein L,D-transpeptidase YcbB/YkuD
MNRDDNPDDWFGEAADEGQAGPAEDWLVPADDRPPQRPWWDYIDRRMVVIAVIAVALLIAVLAAAGVFSGSGSNNEAVTTASTTTTTATTTPATTRPSTPATPAPTAPLKPGDSGDQVKVLQTALAKLGYSPGKVDGEYGPATTEAVKQFQKANNLDADGVVGPKTREALAAKLRAQAA